MVVWLQTSAQSTYKYKNPLFGLTILYADRHLVSWSYNFNSATGVRNVCTKHQIQYFDWLSSESEYDKRAQTVYDCKARTSGTHLKALGDVHVVTDNNPNHQRRPRYIHKHTRSITADNRLRVKCCMHNFFYRMISFLGSSLSVLIYCNMLLLFTKLPVV